MIAQKLVERGHKVTIITGYRSKELKREVRDKIEIIWVPLLAATITTKKYSQFQDHLPPNLKSLLYLSIINYKEHDVIHLLAFGHLLIDYINLVSRSKRKILTVHGFPKYVESEGKATYITKLLYKLYLKTLGKYTLNSAKIITAPTNFVAQDCIKKGDIDSSKIRLIPNGIDLKSYNPVQYDELEEKYKITKDDVLIVSIARIVWLKGLEYAIEAILQVSKIINKSIKYMIIGPIQDYNYYSTLNKQIQRLGLQDNVIFTGHYADLSLKLPALTRSDIFLVPSLHESFGMVVLEAMAMGKPIVASNIEGIACILEHMNTGILVNPTQPNEIANAITTLLFNPELCKKLSENASCTVNKYDWNIIIDSYEKVYQHCQ